MGTKKVPRAGYTRADGTPVRPTETTVRTSDAPVSAAASHAGAVATVDPMAKPAKPVTADTLDSMVEFDGPFTIDGDSNLADRRDVYSPEVYHVEGEREPEVHSKDWEFVDGFSGQHGYSGPVMHESEYLGGGMAQHVIDNPGTYTLAVVEDMDEPDHPAGWVLLRHKDS